MKPTYTFEEACQYLNVGATSLLSILHTGELAAAKISQCWVLREYDLDKYLAEQIRTQTHQRREASLQGSVARVKPAASERIGRLKSRLSHDGQ